MTNGSMEEEDLPSPPGSSLSSPPRSSLPSPPRSSLPSPPRSSLCSSRSPTRSRNRGRGKVTFAQDCSSDSNISDVSTPDPQNLQPYDAPLGRGQAPWTPPLETDPEPQDPVQAPKAWAPEYSHTHWPSLSSSLTPVLQHLASPPPRDTELDLEARTSRLLRLTSDLYVATHQSGDSTVLRRFSEGSSRCQSPAPRSVSVDRLPDHQSPRLQQASRIQHGGSPQRQSMEQGRLDALTPPGPVDYTGQASGSGLYSGLYSPPPPRSALQTGTRYNSKSTTQSSRLGLSHCHSLPRTLSPQPGVAELSSSLRGLLDLVDQHWAGTRSLHLNPSFLGQAYDLLSSALGSPPATSCLKETEEKREGQNRGGQEQSESHVDGTPQWSEVPLLKRKLTFTQQQPESLKKRLVEALKENSNLRLTSLKQDSSTTAETNCGRLWERCLQRQVIALREQETHLRQLEQTMVLLQGNHRSLVSSNNCLLGHLNEHIKKQSPESRESRESSQQTNLMTSTSKINS